MKKMIIMFSALVATGMLTHAAAATYNASTGYVLLTNDAPAAVTAFNAPDGNANWSDNAAPHSNTNYFTNGRTFHTPTKPGTPLTWGGGQLVCNSKFWLVANEDITIDDLVMINGANFYMAGTPGALLGNMTVEGTVCLFHNSHSGGFDLAMKVVGDASSVFRGDSRYSDMKVRLSGDLSEFYGTLILSRSSAAKNGSGSAPVENATTNGYYLATSRVGGKLKVDQGTKLTLENDVTVASLELDDGVPLVFGTVASATNNLSCLTVEGAVTLNGKPRILVETVDANLTAAYAYPLIRFRADQNLTIDDFEIVIGSTTSPLGLYQLKWEVAESAEEGYRELRMVKTAYDGTIISYNNAAECSKGYSPCVVQQDAKGNNFWSDGEIPQADYAYVVTHDSSRAFYVTSTSGKNSDPYEFPGEALFLDNVTLSAASSTGMSAGLVARELYWANGCVQVWGGGVSDKIFGSTITWWSISGGKLYTYDGCTIENISYNSQGIRFMSELVGGGTLKMTTTAAGKATGRKCYNFISALNPEFTGRITVSAVSEPTVCLGDGGTAPSLDNYITLFVTNGLALGGARPSFVYDALKLERYGMLSIARENVTLSDGLNCGVFVSGVGQMKVADDLTLTVARPLTLDGVLYKNGGGTLALGGELRFADGEAATLPAADRNVLNVQSGVLRVEAAHALDGAAVVLSNGTQIVLKETSLTDELATKGLVNVKGDFAADRFAVEGEGTVVVAIDATDAQTSALRATFGIATFPTEAEATACQNKISFARKATVGNAILAFKNASPVLNGDGTYTLKATYVFKGLTVNIR